MDVQVLQPDKLRKYFGFLSCNKMFVLTILTLEKILTSKFKFRIFHLFYFFARILLFDIRF